MFPHTEQELQQGCTGYTGETSTSEGGCVRQKTLRKSFRPGVLTRLTSTNTLQIGPEWQVSQAEHNWPSGGVVAEQSRLARLSSACKVAVSWILSGSLLSYCREDLR